MRIIIVGNDLRTIALARVLLNEGNEVIAIPGFRETKFPGLLSVPIPNIDENEHEWQKVRHTYEIVGLVDQLKPNLVICLHVESSDAGLVDVLVTQSNGNYLVFGVSQKASHLETSKAYGMSIAQSSGLSVPSTEIIAERERERWLIQKKHLPNQYLVVKANGLFGGRGTFICKNFNEIEYAFAQIPYGDIVVQEYIFGYEVALSLLCYKKDIMLLNVNFEYKREHENDKGLNTPGMGTIARSGFDLIPCLRLLQDLPIALDDLNYCGPLDISLIVDSSKQKAFFLEFTTRFGDPELSSEILLLKNLSSLLCMKSIPQEQGYFFNENTWAVGVWARGRHHQLLRSSSNFTHDSLQVSSSTESCFSMSGESLDVIRYQLYENLSSSVQSDSFFRKDIGHDALIRFSAFQDILKI
jgi:phosphoribosylamine-glycine ligase